MNSVVSPHIAKGLIWRMTDNRAVIVLPRTGEIKVLNESGTVVWQLLNEETSLSHIVENIVNASDVSYDCAKKDLQLFLDDLTKKEFLVWES